MSGAHHVGTAAQPAVARTTLAERARARAGTLALLATLAVAAVFVALQPLTAPWWFYADSDAVYVSSGLNIVLGTGTKFFDHPGVPLQQLAALTFEVRRWFSGAHSTQGYVDGLLLHLDATRPYFRAYGVGLFLAGIAVAFALGRRLLGHWGWGVAAGLLVLGAPGLVPMSIQFRADTALPLLLLGGTLLTAEAARRRDGPLFLGAAAVAGLALTFKLSAIPLLAGVVMAAVWRRSPDGAGWERVTALLRRHRFAASTAAALWLFAAVVLNRARIPFHASGSRLALLALLIAVPAGWAAAARVVDRGPLRPFYASLAAAFATGLLVPVTLTAADGLAMLPWIARGITGGGVNETAPLLSTGHLDILGRFPVVYALPLIVLPLAALASGLRRRDPVLTPLALTAVLAAAMAGSRVVGREWYFIPPYLLAISPTLLWLRSTRLWGAAAVAALVGLALVPQALHARDAAHEAAREQHVARAEEAFAARQLGPGAIVLTPPEYPLADTRWFELVQVYDVHAAPRRYRFLPATATAADFAAAHGLHPKLAIGDITYGRSVTFGNDTYAVRRLALPGWPFRAARLGG